MLTLWLALCLPQDVLHLDGADKDAVKKATDAISVDLMKEFVGYLAGDELEGRGTGTAGNEKAGEYIAEVFKKAGLKPVGDKNAKDEPTYFQAFKAGKKNARNVLGLLEGSDPKLKDQIVVVGGHYDHLGRGRDASFGALGRPTDEDDIYNGADDNASGTSTVMALAKAFGESGLKPKRSILFMAFSGEEMGLLGSAYYVRNPAFDIEQHVFQLNMDMVGRNPESAVLLMGTSTAKGDVLHKVGEAAVARSGLKTDLQETSNIGFGDSDHASFRGAKIPILFFFTWIHDDYHNINDEADKIAYENMEKIGESAFYILWAMTNTDARPEFNSEYVKDAYVRNDFPFGIKGEAVTDAAEFEKMGVDDEDEGALKILSVKKDSVAEKAGMKTGDVILSIAGHALPRRRTQRSLPGLLKKNVTRGEEVEVGVWRGGERLTLKAVWPKE